VVLSAEAAPTVDADPVELREALRKCRDALPDAARRVFELRYEQGMNLGEVATELGSNANAVAQAAFRMVRRMRECLRAAGYELGGGHG
jgi:RNA polymerase sigma factor (sigma-70 family)